MPLLSAGLLLVTFALFEISSYISIISKNKKFIVPIVLIVVLLLSWQSYKMGDPLIQSKSTSYGGHLEVGQWIQENIPQETVLFAGSPRIVRAFSEKEYGGPGKWDKGGSLWNLRSPEYLKNKELFEEDLKKLLEQNDVYLEIDVWEYTQPKWYFPISQDSINYFTNLGFQIVYVVQRDVNTQQGLQKIPVIFILKKNKGT